MKPIIKMLFVAVLISGFSYTSHAQQTSGRYAVSTQLKEAEGSYDQRKLYRQFLVEYMKNCPYISHFKVSEAVGTSDNHIVNWNYDVNSWDDITKFYSWVNENIKSAKENGLKMALTPYEPLYAIGGQIHMERKTKAELAKE